METDHEPPKDLLEHIFEGQAELNDNIFRKQEIAFEGPDRCPGKMLDIIRQAKNNCLGPNDLPNIWLGNYLKALRAEAEECEKSLLWKWWSKDKIDIQNVRVEIVDMMHFLVSMALASGMTAKEFHMMYFKKHAVNHNRQEAGYSAANKTEADNRALVLETPPVAQPPLSVGYQGAQRHHSQVKSPEEYRKGFSLEANRTIDESGKEVPLPVSREQQDAVNLARANLASMLRATPVVIPEREPYELRAMLEAMPRMEALEKTNKALVLDDGDDY